MVACVCVGLCIIAFDCLVVYVCACLCMCMVVCVRLRSFVYDCV